MPVAACRGEGVSTVYQPIVDTVRGSIVGYEALTRFSGFVKLVLLPCLRGTQLSWALPARE